jgi:hypothetical protein
MFIEQIYFRHWTAAYRCVAGESELIVVTQIGPRIMSLRHGGSENILYEDRTGFGVDQWKLYGGHRFTTAPETAQSYDPDNAPCDVAVEDGRLRISQPPERGGLQKTLEIGPCGESCFEVRHVLRNTGNLLWCGAAWTLTCVRPAGSLIAAWGSGTDRWRSNMVRYWSRLGNCRGATDSPQWRPADEVFIVEPTGESGKIGLFADRGWLALARTDGTFYKCCRPTAPESLYPDGGCNIEVYSCPEYLEMEMLGPLQTLHPGEETSHIECWRIVAETFPRDQYPAIGRLDPRTLQCPLRTMPERQ